MSVSVRIMCLCGVCSVNVFLKRFQQGAGLALGFGVKCRLRIIFVFRL